MTDVFHTREIWTQIHHDSKSSRASKTFFCSTRWGLLEAAEPIFSGFRIVTLKVNWKSWWNLVLPKEIIDVSWVSYKISHGNMPKLCWIAAIAAPCHDMPRQDDAGGPQLTPGGGVDPIGHGQLADADREGVMAHRWQADLVGSLVHQTRKQVGSSLGCVFKSNGPKIIENRSTFSWMHHLKPQDLFNDAGKHDCSASSSQSISFRPALGRNPNGCWAGSNLQAKLLATTTV